MQVAGLPACWAHRCLKAKPHGSGHWSSSLPPRWEAAPHLHDVATQSFLDRAVLRVSHTTTLQAPGGPSWHAAACIHWCPPRAPLCTPARLCHSFTRSRPEPQVLTRHVHSGLNLQGLKTKTDP